MDLMSFEAYLIIRVSIYGYKTIVLTRVDHLFIHNYMRSLINIILIPILMVWIGLEPVSHYLCV